MTVQNTNDTETFSGNGVATSFPFSIKSQLASDVKVTHINTSTVRTTLVKDTDYSVTLNNDGTSTVVFPLSLSSFSTLATGEAIEVRRVVDLTQLIKLDNQGPYDPKVVEKGFDKATQMVQQIVPDMPGGADYLIYFDSDGIAQLSITNTDLQAFLAGTITANGEDFLVSVSALKTLISTTLTDGEFKYLTGYYAGGDTGNISTYKWVIGSAATPTLATVIIPNDTPATGRWELQPTSIMDVKQFGARPNFAADQQPAIQEAVNAAGNISQGGFALICSPDVDGSLDYRIDSTVTMDSHGLVVQFVGYAYLRPADENLLIGLIIGNPTIQPSHMRLDVRVDRETINTTTENIGILFKEMNQSDIWSESRKSKYPIKTECLVAGNAYNNYHNLQATHGVRNFWFRAVTPGYHNENKYFGGRGFSAVDTDTQLFIEEASNHNMYYGLSLEGAGSQSIFCDGNSNVFDNPRTEGAWTEDDIVFGANAQRNRVFSPRLDLTITDYLSDDSNTWWTRASGMKTESGNNNINHNRSVHTGAHSTAAGGPIVISGATVADPVVVTATAHGLSTGAFFTIRKVVGMVQINNQHFKAGVTTANTLELLRVDDGSDIDGTGFTAYTSGGYILPGVPMNSIEDLGATKGHNTDWFHNIDGADSYVWRAIWEVSGLIRAYLTTNGSMFLGRRLEIEQSGFNFEPFQMGDVRLWWDGDYFRTKESIPSSATDGALITKFQSSVAAGLANIGNIVNTVGKYEGKEVFDTGLNRPVWATGSSAGSTWVFSDGTTAYTPV